MPPSEDHAGRYGASSTSRRIAHGWWDDFLCASAFYTRLPFRAWSGISIAGHPRALRAGPLVGLVVGILGGCAFAIADFLDFPDLVAAATAVAVTLFITGVLHEDGLADVVDGFWGGADRARKLEIMRDSRMGIFGATALIMSIILRIGALAVFAYEDGAIAALIAAHALARGAIPAVMYTMQPARQDGLGASIGQPERVDVITAIFLAAVIAILATGLGEGIILLLLAGVAAALVRLLASRQVGGYTGDVLGAVEQAVEVTALVAAAALA